MIPAPPGLKARFKSTGNGPEGPYTYYTDHRVYAFDDDGTPLIVSWPPERRLVPATQYHDYDGLVESGDDFITLIPGGGWHCKEECTDENGERRVYDQPLVAWALRRDGIIVPLQTDGEGYVHAPETHAEIYHPDHPWEKTTE